MICKSSVAQSLDQRLNEEQFLRGLVELRLPEVLQRYIETHPPIDDVQNAQYRMATHRMSLTAPDLSATKRAEILERILKVRRDLIAAHPNDARRAIWLADQGSDLYFELLPTDASGLTALFGTPSAEQRSRAQRVAGEMVEYSAQAEQAIARTLLDLEAAPGFADNPALQQRRRELAERERDRRIPFLRGVGAQLHAELNLTEPAEKQKMMLLAADSLPALADTLEGAAAIDARLHGGLALARIGRFDAAESLFERVAKDPGADESQVFAARMGGVMIRVTRGGPESGLQALNSIESRYASIDNLFYRILIADQRFLLRLKLAQQAQPPQRQALMADAFASYTDLLTADFAPAAPEGAANGENAASSSPAVPRDVIRSIVFARLVQASGRAPPGLALDQLPPIIAIARAEQMASHPETREQAIVSLEAALQGKPLSPGDQASALFVLGKALYEHGQLLFAAQRFIELADRFPANNQAERSMELGVSIAADLQREHPDDPQVRAALGHALDVLLKRYLNLPTIDHWRYAAGKLALEDNRFDDAMAAFALVTSTSTEWLDAQFMQAATTKAKADKAAEAARQSSNEAAIAVIDHMQTAIESGLNAAAGSKRTADARYYLGSLRVFRAESLLALNRPQQAIDSLAGIENDRTLDSRVIGEALKVRINAFGALKRPQEALHDIEQFIKAAPEQAGAVLAPMLAALQRDVLALLENGRDDEAVSLANRTMLPVARLLDGWLASRPTNAEDEQAFGRRVADAYRFSGQFDDALAWYDKLLRAEPDAADLLVGRAECLYTLGGESRLGDAMTVYKRLAAAGLESGKDQFWLAQLRMLQIIDQVNRHTEQIIPRIERLRQQDSALGGEKYRRGFELLRNKYGKK